MSVDLATTSNGVQRACFPAANRKRFQVGRSLISSLSNPDVRYSAGYGRTNKFPAIRPAGRTINFIAIRPAGRTNIFLLFGRLAGRLATALKFRYVG